MTTSKSTERTHESSTDNTANEDSLLSAIYGVLKVSISISLLKFITALATVSGQFSVIRSAIYILG